jgi:hypothetical protein
VDTTCAGTFFAASSSTGNYNALVAQDQTTYAYGGHGVEGDSLNGVGVYGSTASTSNTAAGVYGVGYASSAGSYGVYGTANNDGGHFVSTGGGHSAVYGSNTGSSGYGGYFTSTNGTGLYVSDGADLNGTLTVSGTTEDYGNVFVGTAYSMYWFLTCEFGACVSDRRLKKNITPIAGAMDRLLQINGVNFEWKEPDEHQGRGIQTGVIAQDVQKGFPEWVTENDKGFETVNIDPRAFLGVVVEAFRTVKARADKADARADKAEERLDRIENHGNLPTGGNPWASLGIAGLLGVLIGTQLKRKSEQKAA